MLSTLTYTYEPITQCHYETCMPTETSSNHEVQKSIQTICMSITPQWTGFNLAHQISFCRIQFINQILSGKMKLSTQIYNRSSLVATYLKASQLSRDASSRLWQHVAKSVTWKKIPGSAGSASLHYMNLGGPVWYGPEAMCPGEGRWCEYGGGGPGPPRYRW
jgi:hypothetical protein